MSPDPAKQQILATIASRSEARGTYGILAKVHANFDSLSPKEAFERLLRSHTDEHFDALLLLETLGAAAADPVREAAEELVANLDLFGFQSAFVFLALTQAEYLAGRGVDERFDVLLENAMGLKNNIVEDLWRPIHAAFSMLPMERRERLMVRMEEFPWEFLSACPTPRMIDHAIRIVEGLPVVTDQPMHTAVTQFTSMGTSMLPRAIAALDKAIPQREVLLRALAAIRDRRAGPVFVRYLADRIESVRATAINGLAVMYWSEDSIVAALNHRGARVRSGGFEVMKLIAAKNPEGIRARVTRLASLVSRPDVREALELIAREMESRQPEHQ